MISLPAGTNIWIAAGVTDLSKIPTRVMSSSSAAGGET
jgi:hypothetical protein